MGNFSHLRQIALTLLAQPALSGILYLAGGALYYLLIGRHFPGNNERM